MLEKKKNGSDVSHSREVIDTLKEGLPTQRNEIVAVIIYSILLLLSGISLYPDSSSSEILRGGVICFMFAIATYTLIKISYRVGLMVPENTSEELSRRWHENFGLARINELTRKITGDIIILPETELFKIEANEILSEDTTKPRRKSKRNINTKNVLEDRQDKDSADIIGADDYLDQYVHNNSSS